MSNKISVIRNGKSFGPYTPQQVVNYVQQNKLLLNDLAFLDNDPQTYTLQSILSKLGLRVQATSPLASIKKIGIDFLFPWASISNMGWRKDPRFLVLAAAGLLPLALSIFATSSLVYIGLAVYASMLWGLFFFSQFKTDQVQAKVCIKTMGISCLFIFALLVLNSLIPHHRNTHVHSNGFFIQFVTMFLVAGIPEEICKVAPIFFMLRRPGTILKPQTVVFYGLLSGLTFGLYEGVLYQMGVNKHMDADTAYYLNILRLTSLPFLHATWCGISSYFIAFSAILPSHRYGLYIIAIIVPALLHALYNSLGIFSILPAFISVLLLMLYLSKLADMKNRMTNP